MNVDLDFCLLVVLIPLGLFIQYWIIRLAVRGGIEDVSRRRQAKLAEEELWKVIDGRGQTP